MNFYRFNIYNKLPYKKDIKTIFDLLDYIYPDDQVKLLVDLEKTQSTIIIFEDKTRPACKNKLVNPAIVIEDSINLIGYTLYKDLNEYYKEYSYNVSFECFEWIHGFYIKLNETKIIDSTLFIIKHMNKKKFCDFVHKYIDYEVDYELLNE